MSSRNRESGQTPKGPVGPENDCIQLPLVARMAMDRPEGLGREPWASHLKMCTICRTEAESQTKSLAVFRAVETQHLANVTSSLTWESFVGALEAEQAAEERAHSRAWWGIPIAATAAGVLAVVGVIGWDGLQEDTAAPARIVRVQPHEQQRMEQVMRWTLDSAARADDSMVSGYAAANVPDTLEAEMSDDSSMDSRELAASLPVRPQPGSSNGDRGTSSRGQLPPFASPERPLPPTMPASNRFGRSQPLFRLEHRLSPAHVVSFSEQDY